MLSQEPVADVRGRIISLSSQHGMVGTPGHVAYWAAKGGVVNLTRQLVVDFARRGIIVNAIRRVRRPDVIWSRVAILAAHATGASLRVIARAAGISYARVFQIIREER